MRFLLALALCAAACSADPVLLPDAGPCSSACGAGTVCSGGACVAVDAGGADARMTDVAEDRSGAIDVPAAPHDQGADAGPADTGAVDAGADVPPDTYGACLANGIRECDGRNVDIQGGEQDGGRRHHCGGCGISCAVGEVCDRCVCAR